MSANNFLTFNAVNKKVFFIKEDTTPYQISRDGINTSTHTQVTLSGQEQSAISAIAQYVRALILKFLT